MAKTSATIFPARMSKKKIYIFLKGWLRSEDFLVMLQNFEAESKKTFSALAKGQRRIESYSILQREDDVAKSSPTSSNFLYAGEVKNDKAL